MKEWIKRATAWFTPGKRAALYAVVAAIVPLVQNIVGFDDAVSAAWVAIGGAVLQLFAGVLMIANLTPSAAASWFSDKGRVAIYAAVAAISPALQTVGLFTPEQGTLILSYISQGLAILGALVAALYIKPIEPEPEATVYVGEDNSTIGVEEVKSTRDYR